LTITQLVNHVPFTFQPPVAVRTHTVGDIVFVGTGKICI
jgi:hypothetical protein